MATQIFTNPWPFAGKDNTQNSILANGSIELYGSYPSGGEPINWASIVAGFAYNELNPMGLGVAKANASAQVTALSASAGTITATAANNFIVGQSVSFIGCTTTLGLLLNGQTFTILTCSATQFTFTSSSTGTGSSETGIAVSGTPHVMYGAFVPSTATVSVTALSASGGTITATAANNFLPGAQVTFQNCTTVLGLLLNGKTFTVTSATATAFKFLSSSTGAGSSETGQAVGGNPPQPYYVDLQDCSATGYSYVYSSATATMHVQQGAASASNPNADIGAGTYSSTLLNALIHFEAGFVKA